MQYCTATAPLVQCAGPVQLVLWRQCTGTGLCWRPRNSQMTAEGQCQHTSPPCHTPGFRPKQSPGHSRVQATARSRPQQATGTKQGQGTQQAPGHSRVQASAGSSLTARSRPEQGPGRSSPCVPVLGDAGRHPVAGGGAG